MATQIIETFTTELTPVQTYLRESFELRRDRPLIWFQRILFWILRKLRCFAIKTDMMVTRHSIDRRKVVEALYKQNADLLSLYHVRGERILIGAEDFRELMGNPELNRLLTFDAEYSWGKTIMGMKITIVPWMRGILVMPKELP